MQNLIILDVPKQSVAALVAELEAADLRVSGSPFWRGAVACTGTEFCKLAITETKSYARWLVEELEGVCLVLSNTSRSTLRVARIVADNIGLPTSELKAKK